ncbi:iron-sulfur cluster carrier protein [Insulibacter thermoxylanivorax]|uniref:Iron-sulfur cluster carrier protein n=1 Tax=Insulibacter thermoxylanivorax TaxID=2749268 RepID=A0A916QHA8_9BACL|nr:Mrp/NBP35 family ATP-binding protein [Insulibacter thermoxylanivorax]GFR39448.1 iron-sulfur cluster carrier protein [Insulibacter thermoxylanivorax]
MLTRDRVLEALQGLREPTYERGYVELNMIRDVLVREDQVALTIVLAEDSEEEKTRLSKLVSAIIREIGGKEPHIRFRTLTEIERQQIERQLAANAVSAKATAHAQAAGPRPGGAHMLSPLLDPASGVKFIAVASGKGGVGKSTVTVNVAAALARAGKKVGIIDADIYGFSVPDMMGIEEVPKLEGDKILPVERFGVKVISMSFFVQDNAPVIWRGPMLGKMLRNFFAEVEWGDVEYILLDLPPGTGDIALDVHQMIPHSKELLVTTPHATAAFVAARAGAMARQTNHEILGVVENMAYYICSHCGEKDYIFGRGGGAKLAQELHTELLAQIPLGAPDNHPSEPDYSPSVYKADSETGKLYAELAARVIEKA